MEEKNEEKYLGDILSNDGRNVKNIKARIERGKGIVSKIISILDSFPFGSQHFEIGIILRDALLSSSMLCNSETWYNITKSEMDLIETVDVMLLRRILNAPKCTPKEILYLELGCLPYRDLIQKRRLMFLFYILKQDPSSMIFKFFESQNNHGSPKDWVSTIKKDLKELDIENDFEQIKVMKKLDFKKMVTNRIEKKGMKVLEEKKANHSKVKTLKHENKGMQKYLKHSKMKITIEERQLIFKMRSEVTNIKMNYKGMYENFQCEVCNEEDETQEHILKCKILNKDDFENVEYSKIKNGNIIKMVKVARKFKKNLKIREKCLKQ